MVTDRESRDLDTAAELERRETERYGPLQPSVPPVHDEDARIRLAAAGSRACSWCGAPAGQPCVDVDGSVWDQHHAVRFPVDTEDRVRAARRARWEASR